MCCCLYKFGLVWDCVRCLRIQVIPYWAPHVNDLIYKKNITPHLLCFPGILSDLTFGENNDIERKKEKKEGGVAEASPIFLRDAHVLPKLFSCEKYCRPDRW
jgi:hypothetical protein